MIVQRLWHSDGVGGRVDRRHGHGRLRTAFGFLLSGGIRTRHRIVFAVTGSDRHIAWRHLAADHPGVTASVHAYAEVHARSQRSPIRPRSAVATAAVVVISGILVSRFIPGYLVVLQHIVRLR